MAAYIAYNNNALNNRGVACLSLGDDMVWVSSALLMLRFHINNGDMPI